MSIIFWIPILSCLLILIGFTAWWVHVLSNLMHIKCLNVRMRINIHNRCPLSIHAFPNSPGDARESSDCYRVVSSEREDGLALAGVVVDFLVEGLCVPAD